MFDEQVGLFLNGTLQTNWVIFPSQADFAYKDDYMVAMAFTNTATSQFFSMNDRLAGTSLPGTSDDFIGFPYSGGTWGASWGHIMGDASKTMLFNMVSTKSGEEAYALPARWYALPSQTNAANISGLLIAGLWIGNPTYRTEVQDINQQAKNPTAYLNYNYGRWSTRRPGKW
jgi:hypothetical protein